jgi:predicted RNA-binding Zn-ribbon protein involved in translation (DUF1610 family)
MVEEKPVCPSCGSRLDELGRLRIAGELKTVHFSCPACGRRFVRDERGLRETKVDLTAD